MSGAAPLATDQASAPAEDWTFRTADTKQVSHGLHPYPAMMIPQIAHRLTDIYGSKGGLLFDPYCGSGTALLEGMLAGMAAIGTDLNPLARLIARVKTRPVSIAALDRAIVRFRGTGGAFPDAPVPPVPNIDYWFSAPVQRDLAAIRQHIDGIHNAAVADAFRAAFSLTVRKVSWARNSEFKLHRIPACQIAKHNPDTRGLMGEALNKVRQSLQALGHAVGANYALPAVHDFNTVSGVPSLILAAGSVNLVVTSPPYGDSRTTVAYGQFSRLSSQWLGYADANRVDNILMGGGRVDTAKKFGFDKLDRVIAAIADIDERRACEVAAFFADYRASIGHVAASMQKGGYACYVVGNRTVKGYRVPTAESTAAFFDEHGFETAAICNRDIPNKRMPSVNSPSNVPGEVGKTMTAEQIVICRKVR